MALHHFISYSAVDGLDYAMRLADGLESGAPPMRVWLDKLEKTRHGMRPGEDWDDQIAEGLRTCETLIFLMTPDSVVSTSVCKQEWSRALKYKKPIIPILLDRTVEVPFRLETREAIMLDGSFDAALQRLREHLLWLASPPGVLRSLEYRLADAERALRRAADDQEHARIADDIDWLKRQIVQQREVVAHPEAAARRVQESVDRGLERERQPDTPAPPPAPCRVVNPPPAVPPSYFQDRFVETRLLEDLVLDAGIRLVCIVGRGGVGKTAMVCRFLNAVEGGLRSDGSAPLTAEAIVHLSASGTRHISVAALFADLCTLLDESTARELKSLYASPLATTAAKFAALFSAFGERRVIVLLDNLEDLIDPDQSTIRDTELADALRAWLTLPPHALKMIVTTRVAPRDVLVEQPARQARIDLDEGLPSPFAENILRAMDVDGKLGLKSAPETLLNEARLRTRGYPRALEMLFAILSADRSTSLGEVLSDTERVLPDDVVRVLVGEAFSRLDARAQQVLQALAIYGKPVVPAAVDFLLQPYLEGFASTSVLNRLVNMQFVRKEAGRYSLHPVDREYGLRRVPRGEVADRASATPVFSQIALGHRGAEFFRQTRTDATTWKSVADLAAPLAEFELRIAADDPDGAYDVLLTIDELLGLWGQYRLSRELHARLDGKLTGLAHLNNLLSLGALEASLGRYHAAIDYLDQALALARELEDAGSVWNALYSASWCFAELGDTTRAIEFGEQALDIAQLDGSSMRQADTLSIVGWYYAKRGLTDRAVDCCRQAVEMQRPWGAANNVATSLANLAGVLLDAGRYQEALALAADSLGIDPDSDRLGNWNNGFIARAHLGLGDLAKARAAAEAGCASDEPENNPNVLTLLGIICLRQGEPVSAADAFRRALAASEILLQFAGSYNALDAKGVAHAGLSLCGAEESLPEAVKSHNAARAVNRDEGVINRLVWLYDALAPADPGDRLRPAREAARG
jgi:tetratricopeptide (TPR) repeat protein